MRKFRTQLRVNEEIHEGKRWWGTQREGKCVRLNRDRAAELTQPVW